MGNLHVNIWGCDG